MQQGVSVQQLTTVNPSAGMYAPIPFINQSPNPGIQKVMAYTANGPQYPNQDFPHSRVSVEIQNHPVDRQGIYLDDTRDVKRPKIEPRRNPPLELAH